MNKMQELLNWLIEQRTQTIEGLKLNKQACQKVWDEGFRSGDMETLHEDYEKLTARDKTLSQIIDKVNLLNESEEEEDGVDHDIWEDDESPVFDLFKEED